MLTVHLRTDISRLTVQSRFSEFLPGEKSHGNKKNANVPSPTSDDAARAESEIDVETTGSMNVDSDVEHVDSNAAPAIGSVKGPDPATYRVDIEHGGEANAGDVERGPA